MTKRTVTGNNIIASWNWFELVLRVGYLYCELACKLVVVTVGGDLSF